MHSASGGIALTGATGFVGGNLARALHRAGWRVRALSRRGADRSRLADLPIHWVEGSLGDQAALETLLEGVSAVAHCAGAVRGARQADFDRVNVDGTARLARIAAGLSVPPRFIHLSSLAAREPRLSLYADSKQRGEEALRHSASGVAWTVLRPPALYGPGDRELFPVLSAMMHGVAPVVGGPEARFSLLHVDDLCEAILRLLQDRAGSEEVFALHDGHPRGYSWAEAAAIASGVRGGRVLRLRLPPALLRPIAAANARLGRLAGRPPMLTPGKLRELRHPDWVCDNAAFTQATGWSPSIDLEQGLRRLFGR
jgi:nucleoside-diphosphate-sugar epimerase